MSIKIGIISDSHRKIGRTKKAIDHLLKNGVEYFIHAGDIVLEENLIALKETKKPYFAIIGNNDLDLIEHAYKYNLYKEPHYFEIEKIKFKLMHLPFFLNGDADVIVFGHTHVFETTCTQNRLYLNPGEVCARNVEISTYAMLEIENQTFTVHKYSRKIKQESISHEKNIFVCNQQHL